MVRQVIPVWPSWSHAEMQQLRLSEDEVQKYLIEFPAQNRFLNASDKVPVFLHSYGNDTGPAHAIAKLLDFALNGSNFMV